VHRQIPRPAAPVGRFFLCRGSVGGHASPNSATGRSRWSLFFVSRDCPLTCIAKFRDRPLPLVAFFCVAGLSVDVHRQIPRPAAPVGRFFFRVADFSINGRAVISRAMGSALWLSLRWATPARLERSGSSARSCPPYPLRWVGLRRETGRPLPETRFGWRASAVIECQGVWVWFGAAALFSVGARVLERWPGGFCWPPSIFGQVGQVGHLRNWDGIVPSTCAIVSWSEGALHEPGRRPWYQPRAWGTCGIIAHGNFEECAAFSSSQARPSSPEGCWFS
jgi:hypothetical protein